MATILVDNVDLYSSSGPNTFGAQLSDELISKGNNVINLFDVIRAQKKITTRPDAHLAFINASFFLADVPLIQRLDGIYYNEDTRYGEWWLQNQPIKETYDRAAGVIFQSGFSKRLVEAFFGEKQNSIVINNGVNLREIENIAPKLPANVVVPEGGNVWVAASNWRPHKRLEENVRYFLEFAQDRDVLVVAGADAEPHINHPRIFYVGPLKRRDLLSLYKRASKFVHLAYHDNCPNVVADARAAGCHIICASCSGSPSIAGPGATIVVEDDWIPCPIKLYEPPPLDFSNTRINDIDSNIDIVDVARRYMDFITGVLS